MVTSVLPIGYKYLIEKEKFISGTNYEASFRIRGLKTEEDAKNWLTQLNEISQVTWKVSRTYPNSGKVNIFRSEYRCQHKVVGGQNYKGLKRTKNTNCPADLRILIRRFWRSNRKQDRDPLVKVWPCIVTISNNHNHPIHSAEMLQYRGVSESTKEQLKNLFNRHHSPLSALEMIKLDLYVNCPKDYISKTVDNYYMPHHQYSYREYQKLFGTNYQKRDKSNETELLENTLSSYNFRAAYTKIGQSNIHIVATLSPIALRTHKLVEQSKSTLHIRTVSVGSCQDRKVKFLLLTTNSGALGQLPLGVIYSESMSLYDNPETLCTGLKLWKSLLPPDAFYGKRSPDIILLDSHYIKYSPVLTNDELFPSAKVYLNQNYILTQSWNWLMDEKSGINPVDRWELYRRIKTLIETNHSVDLQESYENCLYCPTPSNLNYSNYADWIESIYTNSVQKWPNCMRRELSESQVGLTQPSKNMEILSTLLLTQLFSRTKNFNILQFSDFVLSTLETYWKNLILDCISHNSGGTYVNSQLNIFLPSSGDMHLNKVQRVPFGQPQMGLYEVTTPATSDSNTPSHKFIDFDILRCSCKNYRASEGHGQLQLCSHLGSIIYKYSIHQCIYTTITPTSNLRSLYYKVATGQELTEAEDVKPQSIFTLPPRDPACTKILTKTLSSAIDPIPIQHELQDYSKLAPEETQEGKQLVEKINKWFEELFKSNPFTVYPALKTMWRTIQTLNSGNEQTDALFNFGKELNPLINRIEVMVPERKSKPVSRSKRRARASKPRKQQQPLRKTVRYENEVYEEMLIQEDQGEGVAHGVHGISMPIFISEDLDDCDEEEILESDHTETDSYDLISTGPGTYVPVINAKSHSQHELSQTSSSQNYVTIVLTTNNEEGDGQGQSHHESGQVVSYPFNSSEALVGRGQVTNSSIILSAAQLKQLRAQQQDRKMRITTTSTGNDDDDDIDNHGEGDEDEPPEMELEIDII